MNTKEKIKGLILAGGESKRMGKSKALINYHGKAQYLYLFEILSEFCEKVYISCRANQVENFEKELPTLPDLYENLGPMNGLFSAFEKEKSAWFVLACDYPLLKKETLKDLIDARNKNKIATVFQNPTNKKPEPLIGIYEKSFFPILKKYHEKGGNSLQKLLLQNDCELLKMKNPKEFLNVNSPKEMELIKIG